jgi:hypothetical protein
MDQDIYANMPGSGGWRYDYRPKADYKKSTALIGRIMVGKLPNTTTPDQLSQILSRMPLPRRDVEPIENCVSWTRAALEELQKVGAAEPFNIAEFMDHAMGRASAWHDAGLYPGKQIMENYTERKFK